MFSTHVPKHFWGEAILTTTYLINRMPSRVLNFQTPCQLLLHSYPNTRIVSTIPLKVFGCSVFVHVHQQHRSKLDPKALKCIFLGYSPNQKGYKFYSPITKRLYTSMDVTFFEHQPYYPKSDIQGKNLIQEYQLWDIDATTTNNYPSPQVTIPPISTTPTPNHSHQIETKSKNIPPSSTPVQCLKLAINGEFIKEKIQEDLEKQAPPKQSQESDPNARIHETSPGNTSSEFITNESIANES